MRMVEGAPVKDETGAPLHCYNNGLTPSGCSSGTACTLPGPRHGHSATSFYIQGMVVYSIFGGESTPLMRAKSSSLTNDVHTAFFEGTNTEKNGAITCQGACEASVTWIKLWTTCDVAQGRCPEKRRDAAVSVMSNNLGNNGRLLIFGGLGGASQDPQSPLYYKLGMKSYLDKKVGTMNVKAFDDLWYV
jgi:hypothetical protein